MPRLPARPRNSTLVFVAGAGIVLLGGALSLAPWLDAARWRDSPEAARAQRNADAPAPIWVTPRPAVGTAVTAGTPVTSAVRTRLPAGQPATPTPNGTTLAISEFAPGGRTVATDTAAPAEPVAPPPTAPLPTATPAPSDLQLIAAQFQFSDPPEPGAHARLTVSVHNPTDSLSDPVTVALPMEWLSGYRIETLDPPPLDGVQIGGPSGGTLRLTFDGPDANSDIDLGITVVATDEVIDAPLLTMTDAAGRQVAHLRPPTEAPPARPGPIYAIDIPTLGLHSGVVPVDWEPPLFVVGQLRSSTYVTQGNSVLVGHVRGAPGYNVFDHLDRVRSGDRIIASSRGETYDFVVTQTQVLPESDTSPTDASGPARLTLMTCAGTWNPLTQDYPDRLWVIAEPTDTTAAAITARQTPTPVTAAVQLAAPGGLGNTDADLVTAFGPPRGESRAGLAVYRATGASTLEHRAQLADVPSSDVRRAVLVASVPPSTAPLAFEAATEVAHRLLPKDARPRGAGPEGNQRFTLERFTSAALAAQLPGEWFSDRQGQPGDLLIVYARRPDGRITNVIVGLGDDPDGLLSRFPELHL